MPGAKDTITRSPASVDICFDITGHFGTTSRRPQMERGVDNNIARHYLCKSNYLKPLDEIAASCR